MSKLALSVLCGLGFAVVGAQAFAETSTPPAKPGVFAVPKATPAPPPGPGGAPSNAPKRVRFRSGSETWTDVSGYSGEGSKRRAGPETNILAWGMNGIKMNETSDDPNIARVFVKDLDTAAQVNGSYAAEIGNGHDNGHWDNDQGTLFAQRKFVRGAAVCTGDEKDSADRKIKGMRVFYAIVSSEGVVDAADTTGEEWRRTNCKVWHAARFCDSKKVARAARFVGDAKDKWFRGVQLECMTPELY